MPSYFFEKNSFNCFQDKIKTNLTSHVTGSTKGDKSVIASPESNSGRSNLKKRFLANARNDIFWRKIALFLDFDGTLVPIQKDPAECFLSEEIKRQLRLLANSKHCYLSILSGRSLSDIRERVGIRKICYGGNHGLDISGPGLRYTHPEATSVMPILNHIRQQLQKKIKDIKGAWLEDKKFTLSLHFRSVKTEDIPQVKKVFYNAVNDFLEKNLLTVIKGKKVLELVSDVLWDKGRATLWLLQQFSAKGGTYISPHRKRASHPTKLGYLPIYIGDDQTDETAFKALSGKGLTIRVGKSRKTLADYYLKGYWEIPRLLQKIHQVTENFISNHRGRF